MCIPPLINDGVVLVLNGNGPQDAAAFAGKKKVVLRAELDALPIQEQTGLPYASENAGVMHACGHDGIVASALVLARILVEEGEAFPVRMRFLFEPAEEIGEGAKRMLAAGALDGEPDIFSCFITQWISLLEWQCMRDRLRL